MKSLTLTSILLSVIFLLTSFSGNSQKLFNTNDFWKGEITTTSGEIIQGFIRSPHESKNKVVAYRLTQDGEKLEIKSDQVQSVAVASEKGKAYMFERLAVRANFKKEKVSKKKGFLLVYKKGDHATFYIASNFYQTSNKTGTIDIVSSYQQTKDLPGFTYYIRKKEYSFADVFAMTSPSPTMFGLNNALKVRSRHLIADDPELVQRIEDGEFKHTDIPEIIELYLENMDKKIRVK